MIFSKIKLRHLIFKNDKKTLILVMTLIIRYNDNPVFKGKYGRISHIINLILMLAIDILYILSLIIFTRSTISIFE